MKRLATSLVAFLVPAHATAQNFNPVTMETVVILLLFMVPAIVFAHTFRLITAYQIEAIRRDIVWTYARRHEGLTKRADDAAVRGPISVDRIRSLAQRARANHGKAVASSHEKSRALTIELQTSTGLVIALGFSSAAGYFAEMLILSFRWPLPTLATMASVQTVQGPFLLQLVIHAVLAFVLGITVGGVLATINERLWRFIPHLPRSPWYDFWTHSYDPDKHLVEITTRDTIFVGALKTADANGNSRELHLEDIEVIPRQPTESDETRYLSALIIENGTELENIALIDFVDQEQSELAREPYTAEQGGEAR